MKKNYMIPMTEAMPLGVVSALCVSGGEEATLNISSSGLEQEKARAPKF